METTLNAIKKLVEINNINSLNVADAVYNLNNYKTQNPSATPEDEINYIITYLKAKNFVKVN